MPRTVDALTMAAVATVVAAVIGTVSMPGMQQRQRMGTVRGSEDVAGAGVSVLHAPLPARLSSQPVLPRLLQHRQRVQTWVHLTLLVVSRGVASSAVKMRAGAVLGVTLRPQAAAVAAVAGSVAAVWPQLLLLPPRHPLPHHLAPQLKALPPLWRRSLWARTSKSRFLSRTLHQ